MDAMRSGDAIVCILKLNHAGFSLNRFISLQCTTFLNV